MSWNAARDLFERIAQWSDRHSPQTLFARALIIIVVPMLLLYQAIVSKRSGELARSAKARTRISGDRYVGVVEVEASYAASHEFGHDQRGVRRDGFDELREVLKNLED